jgi:hypothetical protein
VLTKNVFQIEDLLDLVSQDEVMSEAQGYDGDGENGKGKERARALTDGSPDFFDAVDEFPKRGRSVRSGELLRYIDGEPEYVP